MTYIDVPDKLDENAVIAEYGADAFKFYQARLRERQRQGKVYPRPLKTIYIWAGQDRQSHQGFYTTWRGYAKRKKNKNYGGS